MFLIKKPSPLPRQPPARAARARQKLTVVRWGIGAEPLFLICLAFLVPDWNLLSVFTQNIQMN